MTIKVEHEYHYSFFFFYLFFLLDDVTRRILNHAYAFCLFKFYFLSGISFSVLVNFLINVLQEYIGIV